MMYVKFTIILDPEGKKRSGITFVLPSYKVQILKGFMLMYTVRST
jgi:hypothetical protein